MSKDPSGYQWWRLQVEVYAGADQDNALAANTFNPFLLVLQDTDYFVADLGYTGEESGDLDSEGSAQAQVQEQALEPEPESEPVKEKKKGGKGKQGKGKKKKKKKKKNKQESQPQGRGEQLGLAPYMASDVKVKVHQHTAEDQDKTEDTTIIENPLGKAMKEPTR
eukprot:COSAG01_NODE_1788_length_9229_cov_55.522125_3_plen_165_part_00